MLYMVGHLTPCADVMSLPLGQKRQRGKPKKLPHCLVREEVFDPLVAEIYYISSFYSESGS